MFPLSNVLPAPLSVTVWVATSLFVHVTEAPALMVIGSGWYAEPWIVAFVVAACAGHASAAPTASTAQNTTRARIPLILASYATWWVSDAGRSSSAPSRPGRSTA